jgi:hypothetical protein
MYRAQLRIKCPHRSVRSLRSNQLKGSADGVFELFTEAIHEIVVIEK